MNNGQKYLNEQIEKLQSIQKKLYDFSFWKNPKIESHLQEISMRIQYINQILENQEKTEKQYFLLRQQILNDNNSQNIGKNIDQDIIYTYNLEFLSQRQSKCQSFQDISETCYSVIINQINSSSNDSEQQKAKPLNNQNQQNQQFYKSNDQFDQNLSQSSHLSQSQNQQQKEIDTNKPLKNYHQQNQQIQKNTEKFDQNLLQSQNQQFQSQILKGNNDELKQNSSFQSQLENTAQKTKINIEIQPNDKSNIQQKNAQFEQTEQIKGEKYDSPIQSDNEGEEMMYSAISSHSKIEQFKQQQQLQQQKNMPQELNQEIKQTQDQMNIKNNEDSKQIQVISEKNLNLTKQIKRKYWYQVKQELVIKMKEDMNQYKMSIVDQPQISEDGSLNLCPICYDRYFADSDYQDKYVISLSCSHQYHYDCLQPLLNKKSLKCPVCNQIFGEQKGDQPDGTMDIKKIKSKCAGYKCDTIQITYKFPSGLRNGRHYYGTTRYAFLPDNGEGNYVLSLLQKAFKQKLLFTIGTSLTTGEENCVIWNGIHHKTSLDGGSSNYGYPDPTYFDRVVDELKQKGII
ncbi:unnamed protein product [Paramecium sonneborni]|uniref:RING-type domain-containing protein n=1 Tax=Paramecium sonneborni TaxID=65129 RepID=A0A8S1PJU1_9CILI|nr:unnamed protein product [Paramecium sonneborni]